MLRQICIHVEWSLIFTMLVKKVIQYVTDKVIRACSENLSGTLTFSFNKGTLVNFQITSHEKPCVDDHE